MGTMMTCVASGIESVCGVQFSQGELLVIPAQLALLASSVPGHYQPAAYHLHHTIPRIFYKSSASNSE